MNFSMIILNQRIVTRENCATWIQTALLFILKLKMFLKILQMTMKEDLIHQIIKSIDHYLQKKNDRIDERRISSKDYDRICCC